MPEMGTKIKYIFLNINCNITGVCSFHPNYQIYWHTVAHSILSIFSEGLVVMSLFPGFSNLRLFSWLV